MKGAHVYIFQKSFKQGCSNGISCEHSEGQLRRNDLCILLDFACSFHYSHRMQGSLEIFVKSLNAGNGQMLSSFSKQHYNASARTEATQTKF